MDNKSNAKATRQVSCLGRAEFHALTARYEAEGKKIIRTTAKLPAFLEEAAMVLDDGSLLIVTNEQEEGQREEVRTA